MTNEYVEKFSYRTYDGTREPRWKRIWSLAWFELVSTWHKSTVGKVLLIIILALNLLVITITAAIFSADISGMSDAERSEEIAAILHGMAATYLEPAEFGDHNVVTSSQSSFSFEIGFLIIGLFAIAGSGFFADDRQGKVMEIYLSRMQRVEYVAGKVGAILLYVNIFLTVPILIMGGLYIQAFGADHFDYLYFYAGVILYGILASLLIGLAILLLSSVVEKRMYASLGFYLLFILGTMFGQLIAEQDPSNEFLLLVSPANFLELLGYVCLGDFELFITEWVGHGVGEEEDIYRYSPFSLNDGKGLEWVHILGATFALIIIMFLFLVFQLRRLTTESLQ
ncbi:MAG: ABC transporter permease subunit [Candidatus Hodarchaeales archaeon]|jgi:hypothetical protein